MHISLFSPLFCIYSYSLCEFAVSLEESQIESPPLTPEKVLELIEQAYPNPVTPEDLAKDYGWEEQDVLLVFVSLKERGLIKSMEYNSYTRIHHEDKEIKVVKQMPTIASNKQPTIAIITAQYCEKLAVDAMLENKETFVRYTTVGKSHRKYICTYQFYAKVCSGKIL
ncbi:PREDICTED: uncharacterized protein LOC108355620 [Rhagoletis zephyria]|uniref:uncharacterized protein LOC108355620 n=1 Tax=Rhagoletis zephyria TaxID=28612 RepID=UPI0008112C96|nr:PREDICTED: uncharacterized protein LOC108355620 [Rhagoletis zephyria]